MIAQKVISLIKTSQIKKNSDLFLRVLRIAYIDAKLWDQYKNKGLTNDLMLDLSEDALIEMIEYVDKSIKFMRLIKDEADKLKGQARQANLTGIESQNRISDALRFYVKVEKDYQSLNDLADAIERVGVAEQEEKIRQDLQNLYSDISFNALKVIEILKQLRTKALDEVIK